MLLQLYLTIYKTKQKIYICIVSDVCRHFTDTTIVDTFSLTGHSFLMVNSMWCKAGLGERTPSEFCRWRTDNVVNPEDK